MGTSIGRAEKRSDTDSSKKDASTIGRVREHAKPQVDPIGDLAQRSVPGARDPSLGSMAVRLASLPAAQRWDAAMSLQKTVGNQFVQRLAMQMKTATGESKPEGDQSQSQFGQNAPMAESIKAKTEPNRAEFNRTGLPDMLKAGIERLSGLSLDDVRVYRNSPKPEGLQALAYTQGNQIYVAPGKEDSLPHEAWHVVQQKQGRVRPGFQMKDAMINDDAGLEEEASEMGAKAMAKPWEHLWSEQTPIQRKGADGTGHGTQRPALQAKKPRQITASADGMVVQRERDKDKWEIMDLLVPYGDPKIKILIAGEAHHEIPPDEERKNWDEIGIKVAHERRDLPKSGIRPDPIFLRAEHILFFLERSAKRFFNISMKLSGPIEGIDIENIIEIKNIADSLWGNIISFSEGFYLHIDELSGLLESPDASSSSPLGPLFTEDGAKNKDLYNNLSKIRKTKEILYHDGEDREYDELPESFNAFSKLDACIRFRIEENVLGTISNLKELIMFIHTKCFTTPFTFDDVSKTRSWKMFQNIRNSIIKGEKGVVYKIGFKHEEDMEPWIHGPEIAVSTKDEYTGKYNQFKRLVNYAHETGSSVLYYLIRSRI